MTETDIRTDLLKEKLSAFSETRTFTLLHETYRAVAGKPVPFAMVPDITLESVKIKNHMTTQIFADRVNRRYQRCMAAK